MKDIQKLQNYIMEATAAMGRSMQDFNRAFEFMSPHNHYCHNCSRSNIESRLPFIFSSNHATCDACGVIHERIKVGESIGYTIAEVNDEVE